jgi:hypothetical protein
MIHFRFLILIILLFLIGCSKRSIKKVDYEHQALFTVNNILLEDSESDVILEIENDIRIDIPYHTRKTAVVSGRKVMMEFSLFVKKPGYHIVFFAGIRPGHTYTMRFSPCCLFQIDDRDDDPYGFPGESVFTDSLGECPEGSIPLFPGLAEDPPELHRCIPAPRLRFDIPEEIVSHEPLTVYIGESIGNEIISLEEDGKGYYHSFDIVRSGSPTTVRLVQGGNILWEGSVVFRVKHSYTLTYDPDAKQPVIIHLDE